MIALIPTPSNVARMIAESTLETEAPRERIRQLAGLE
jgi:hypothetical protein